MSGNGCALVVSGISVTLDNRPILTDVSLTANPGEMVGLIGPNGAGKTTLFRVVAGLLKPAAGEVALVDARGSRNVRQMRPRDLARDLALVPQDTTIGFAFPAREIVLMGRHPHLGRFQVEGPADVELAEAAMAETGVTHLADRPVTQLSGGERQMIFVAKALAQQPRVLLLDEPVSALDVLHQLDVLQVARRRADAGVTLVVVLHDLNLAARFCDRLVLLTAGKVMAAGDPAAVLAPELLDASYGVHAAVRRDLVLDRMAVTAIRAARQTRPVQTVHVVGGGGTAGKLLAHLYREGFSVSLGPVEAHDPDAILARDLGIQVADWPSFTNLGEDALAASLALGERADICLATDVPLGPVNAGIAPLATALGCTAVVNSPPATGLAAVLTSQVTMAQLPDLVGTPSSREQALATVTG